uniref:Inhibitor I9 domain-containing protein n=1 Tax=Oryza brachyantha TaxID=4533 RepID=J3LFW1_ORYBR
MELAHVVPPRRHDNLRKKRRLMHSHQHVLDGFASWLTEAELEAVSIKLGFSKSTLDGPMYLDTTHSPSFLGLSPDNFWGYTEYGSGVIIGVIDFGINSSHPSQTGGKASATAASAASLQQQSYRRLIPHLPGPCRLHWPQQARGVDHGGELRQRRLVPWTGGRDGLRDRPQCALGIVQGLLYSHR